MGQNNGPNNQQTDDENENSSNEPVTPTRSCSVNICLVLGLWMLILFCFCFVYPWSYAAFAIIGWGLFLMATVRPPDQIDNDENFVSLGSSEPWHPVFIPSNGDGFGYQPELDYLDSLFSTTVEEFIPEQRETAPEQDTHPPDIPREIVLNLRPFDSIDDTSIGSEPASDIDSNCDIEDERAIPEVFEYIDEDIENLRN